MVVRVGLLRGILVRLHSPPIGGDVLEGEDNRQEGV